MSSKVWIDSELIAADAAHVSVFDRSFSVGDGVFETLKVDHSTALALTRHVRRLARSAAGLGLPEPDRFLITNAVAELIDANSAEFGSMSRLRIQYSAGTGGAGSERASERTRIVITQTKATQWPATTQVITVPWARNEKSPVVGLKTTSYAENVVALARANAVGSGEALFANTVGDLCEGTGSNVFVVLAGQLLTPPISSGCLPGITRELVLEWVGARETDLPMSALADAQEIFITSSTRDIQPVSHVDGRLVEMAPGPVTVRAQEIFAQRMAQTPDP